MGARSNLAAAWESGRRSPTAAKTFWVAGRVGVDARGALAAFLASPEFAVDSLDPSEPAGVARVLEALRGRTSVADVARRTGRSRFAVARWLKGDAEPRLPDFFRLVEAMSLRLLDFVAAFVPPQSLPSIASAWRELEVARRSAYDLPWSHAVLRAVELDEYRRRKRHEPGFIAALLGIEREQEDECLEALRRSGQIRLEDGRYEPRVLAVDTRRDPARDQALKSWWSGVAKERLDRNAEGQFSYNLFTVSEADYQRLRELQRAYFRELRTIVAESEPAERVVLANVQLVPLTNAPRRAS